MKDAGSRDNEHDTATRGDASEFTVRPLPLGHRLGELQLDEVLGIGGFGIVYRAFDRTLRRAVAIKEYMPSMLATRGGDYTVSLRSERFAQAFDAGRGAFLNEARLLAQFDHPGNRQGPAFLGKPRHRVHGDAVLRRAHAQAAARRRDADQRDAVAQYRRRAARRARHAASRAVLPSRRRARQRADPPERQRDPARLRRGPQTDRRPGRRWRDDDQARLCADRAVHRRSRVQPGAVDRPLCARRGDARDDHRRAAARGRRAQHQDTYRPLASRELPAGEVYSPAFLAAVDHALQLRIPDRPESVAAFAAGFGLRDVGTGGGYGAAVVPPVGDAGRSGEGKGRLLLRPLRRRLLARLRSARAGPLRATLRRMGER